MQAILNGTVIAESDDIVMVDGNSSIPRESTRKEWLIDSRFTTVCGWKGAVWSWDITVGHIP